MMREILFRGKRVDNDKWVYGYYRKIYFGQELIDIICDDNSDADGYAIDIDSVGQYTGSKDKNGVKIFEGDILAEDNGDEIDYVSWEDQGWTLVPAMEGLDICSEATIVIGNIHDNQELLEGD